VLDALHFGLDAPSFGLDALGLALDAHVLALVFLYEVVLGLLPSNRFDTFGENQRNLHDLCVSNFQNIDNRFNNMDARFMTLDEQIEAVQNQIFDL